MNTLTPSGKGIKISDRKATDFTREEIKHLLNQYHWIVFTDNPVSETEALGFLNQFGPLTDNNRRKNGVLTLDGSKEQEGEVLLGQGFMPLHRDGALMGTHVLMVGILCLTYRQITRGGRTFITDLESATQAMPKAHLDLLRERNIEGKPVDSYYLKASTQWHPIPSFIEVEGKSVLNIGLPYPTDEKPSWLVRIPGVDYDKAQEILFDLARIMMDPQYCYHHTWQEGELLLFDNRKTLHGREAYSGQRTLANIQVLVG